MKRAHKGTMLLVERKSGLQVWVYRWFEEDQAGEPWRRKRALGAITRFKSETAAWREVERLGLGPIIKAVAVEEWLGKLQRTLGEEKIDLAPGSKKKIRDVMHVLFKHAIRYEWMDRNPIVAALSD